MAGYKKLGSGMARKAGDALAGRGKHLDDAIMKASGAAPAKKKAAAKKISRYKTKK